VRYHLVLAAIELPNDNPSLSDPCGVMAFAYDRHEYGPEPDVEAPAPEAVLELAAPIALATAEAVEATSQAAAEEEAEEAEQEPIEAENDEESGIEIVEQFDPVEFELVEQAPELAEVADPFTIFVRTLVRVAEDAGCTRAAALLPALLDGAQVDAAAFAGPTIDSLVNSGVLARAPSGLVGGEAFRRTAHAWRAILRGDSDDFGACGPRMLDEWAADLVARIVAAPARTEQLRRELRTRGIAAFGIVLAA